MALIPTLFPGFTSMTGPKHSIFMPLNAGVAVPLSVDKKEVAAVSGPNPIPGTAVKA